MNKKRLIIVIVVFIVIIGGLIGYLVGKGGDIKEEDLANYAEGTDKYIGLTKTVVVTYDVLKGEAELKYVIDSGLLELGMLKTDISFTNNSQKLLAMAEVKLELFGSQGNVLFSNSLGFADVKPGQTRESSFGMTDLSKLNAEPEKIALTVWRVLVKTTVPSTPTATPTPLATVSPTKGSPGEAVRTFFEALKSGQYAEAEKYLCAQTLEEMKKAGDNLEKWAEREPNEIPIKITIIGEDIEEGRGWVEADVYFPDGKINKGLVFDLVKESNAWKIRFN